MSDEQKMLAEAWRDLAGWHVGMAAVAKHPRSMGGIVVSVSERQLWVDEPSLRQTFVWEPGTTGLLPDLESPANWGHWLAWVAERVDPNEAGVQAGEGGWVALVGLRSSTLSAAFPDALLHAYMEDCEEQGTDQDQPPSVLAWWKEHGQ